jgi:hypothetical protein
VRVLGGFTGVELVETDRNENPETNGCVLSGDINGDDVPATWSNYSDNCYHVVIFDGLTGTPKTELDAFTIRGGNAFGIPGGGGILVSGCNNVRVLRCLIVENQAVVEGGGMKMVGSTDTEVRWCEVARNRTTSTHAGQGAGAGIQCKEATFNLISSRVRDNIAAGPGAGIAFWAGTGTTNVFNSDIRGNRTLSNSSMDGGGIWGLGSATLVVANTLIVDNEAGSLGGGVFTTTFMNLDLRNCTIAGNAAGTSGGGLHLDSTQSVTILNSIVWGNTAGADAGIDANGATLTLGHSNVQNVTPSGTIISSDPLFVSPGNGVYALTCGSPCVDAGHDNSRAQDVVDVDVDADFSELSPLDVEGYARVVDVLGGTDDVDMGAHEIPASNSGCPGDANHDGMVDSDDIIAVILNWGACGSPSTGCLGDMHTHPCGNGQVDSDDMTYVILFWGPCPGGFPIGAPKDLPQDFQDCMDKCAEEFPNEPERWAACVASCYEATGGE